MQAIDPGRWSHSHSYSADSSLAERRTRWVILLTASMMIAEIAAGSWFGSMALLADGWHMGTHVAAFLIAAIAYRLERRYAADRRFSFGTGKFAILGGYTSAIFLGAVALLMAFESVQRLFRPAVIRFDQAIAVAAVGLAVNLICALLLRGATHPGHTHDHAHSHGSHAHDPNLRSAYVHVLADALTSITAIVALAGGRWFGWNWLDPVMGLVGSAVVGWWAVGLLRNTGGALLDRTPSSSDLPEEIRRAVEHDGQTVIDLHVWQVAAGRYAAIVSVAGSDLKNPADYHELLGVHEELVHLTVETRVLTADWMQAADSVRRSPAHSDSTDRV